MRGGKYQIGTLRDIDVIAVLVKWRVPVTDSEVQVRFDALIHGFYDLSRRCHLKAGSNMR